MHNIKMKAVVTRPDGTLFYREEHEWTQVDDVMLAWFMGKMKHMLDFADKGHGKKEDAANLTAVLSASIDDVAMPDASFTGVSYHGLVKFEREWLKVGAELVDLGEKQAKNKK